MQYLCFAIEQSKYVNSFWIKNSIEIIYPNRILLIWIRIRLFNIVIASNIFGGFREISNVKGSLYVYKILNNIA